MIDLAPWLARPGVRVAQLHPDLKRRLARLLGDHRLGGKVRIASAVRTYAEQKDLYDRWKAGTYKVPVVARPGTSNHEVRSDGYGHAVDLDFAPHPDDWVLLERVAREHGLRRTVPSEGWHYELDPAWVEPQDTPEPQEETVHELVFDAGRNAWYLAGPAGLVRIINPDRLNAYRFGLKVGDVVLTEPLKQVWHESEVFDLVCGPMVIPGKTV